MKDPAAEKWNQRYRESREPGAVAEVLQRNAHLLPGKGLALDLACGRGANALFLARAGLQVQAWDFSANALAQLQQQAAIERLPVVTQNRDVVRCPPDPAQFNVIVVSLFLDRSITDNLVAALKPGGLLFYQTFVKTPHLGRGPDRAQWRLAPSELLRLFSVLDVVYYREDGRLGQNRSPLADLALFVGVRNA